MYYLTKATVMGDKALTACASGYHMASIVELSDLSHLHYLTTYAGAYQAPGTDQGDGPPLQGAGWVRTNNILGLNNCMDWTSNSSSSTGTIGYIYGQYDTTTEQAQVYWIFNATLICNNKFSVWCIENP